MVQIPLGYTEGDASKENLARIRLRNMYVTENTYSPDGMSRLSRPTLTEELVLPFNQPVYGIWRQEGTLNGLWLIVVAEKLYTYDISTLTLSDVGEIPGTAYCLFAGTTNRVVIVRNSVAYSFDGTTITPIVMPDDRPVGSVATIDGYFILGQEDAQRFYWIAPGETDPDALSFASAERSPDSVKSINILSDEVWFLGGNGVEVWQPTGDADLPWQRIAGRVYSEGCVDPATAVTLSYKGYPALLWITEKRAVMLAQGSPSRISSKSVEDQLKTATNFRCWGFRFNLHDFYVISTSEVTLVYDLTVGTWMKWDSYLKKYWRAHLGIQVNENAYAADSETGTIWLLEDGYSDDEEIVVREVSGFLFNSGNNVSCSSVNLRMNVGWPPNYNQSPLIEMRFSDDYGFSWSNYFQANMGQKGKYEYDVTWRSLGSYSRPGREFEFRFSEPAKFRIDYATMNEV